MSPAAKDIYKVSRFNKENLTNADKGTLLYHCTDSEIRDIVLNPDKKIMEAMKMKHGYSNTHLCD